MCHRTQILCLTCNCIIFIPTHCETAIINCFECPSHLSTLSDGGSVEGVCSFHAEDAFEERFTESGKEKHGLGKKLVEKRKVQEGERVKLDMSEEELWVYNDRVGRVIERENEELLRREWLTGRKKNSGW